LSISLDESDDAKRLMKSNPNWRNILPHAIWRCKDPRNSQIKPCSHIPQSKGRHPIIVSFPIDDLPDHLNGDCSRFSQDADLTFWTCEEVDTCIRDTLPCMKDTLHPECQNGFTWMVNTKTLKRF
jgi:hypothetical protein